MFILLLPGAVESACQRDVSERQRKGLGRGGGREGGREGEKLLSSGGGIASVIVYLQPPQVILPQDGASGRSWPSGLNNGESNTR